MVRFTRYCPVPMPDGSDCWREPHPDSKHSMCPEHWGSVIRDFTVKTTSSGNRDVPKGLRQVARCPVCGQVAHVGLGGSGSFTCKNPMCFVMPVLEPQKLSLAQIARMKWDIYGIGMYFDPKPPQGWVYYLRFGDRVKIGTTVNLKRRFNELPHDEILAIERGSYDVEKQRHKFHDRDRVPSQREWFHATPRVLSHAAMVRRQNGDPAQLMAVYAA